MSSHAQGRGTVVTGRVEQGIVRTGDEIEILGINAPIKSTVTGVEMFKKQLNEGQAGDNVGLLLRGIKRDDVVRGQVPLISLSHTPQLLPALRPHILNTSASRVPCRMLHFRLEHSPACCIPARILLPPGLLRRWGASRAA